MAVPTSPKLVIAVGASAGGVEALQSLVSCFSERFAASVLVVMHVWAASKSYLPEILSRASVLSAVTPADGQKLEAGYIYSALPDHHLLVQDSHIRVMRGPTENRHRPSINVLFRSVAMTFGPRAVGVLLTGSDDDGAAGLYAIKQAGGTVIVQDPAESLYPQMPLSALQHVTPDYLLPLNEICLRLACMVETSNGKKMTMEPNHPVTNPEKQLEGVESEHMGVPSAFTCPDCGGTLWELHEGELTHYVCRVGHKFSTEVMLQAESDTVERALWTAVRVLKESADVNRRLSRVDKLRDEFLRRADERERDAKVIRQLLQRAEPIE